MTSSAFFFCCLLKGAERPCPHLIEVRSQPGHSLGIELIKPARSCLGVGHEAHILQYLEVLRYCGTRNREHAGELVHRNGAGRELLKDRHPSCIGESIEPGL